MKFRLDRDVLADAVAWVARSLPTRPSVPVLAGLLLNAKDGELVLSGFDYETSARVSLPAEIAVEGSVLVSGRLLADISRSLPAQPVDIEADGGKVVVTCRSARFTIQTLPVDEYPDLPEMPTASGTVKGDVLAAAVAQVAIAAGRDDMLPVLTGVRIEIEGSSVTLAATDRYRLAVRELSWSPERPDVSATALVPARVLADTAKSFTSGSEVTIALATPGSGGGEGLVGFAGQTGGGMRRTTTRLLDGEFPKYRTLFPPEQQTIARIETAPFVETLKRVALVAERNTPIRLTLGDSEARLEAGSSDEAQASESLQAQIEGEGLTIGFNPQYLLDGLGVIDTPVAQLAFTQANRPAVLTGAPAIDAEANLDYRYLLMPVRLQG
ncbi:DNA polymerase III subunit beta [Tenggerimyces flavus]|uniref:Beta sliding clamp n=1 Tax=Tenggerimyces flavus TaxID=1708749 RepID=A0ABV7YG76_9ACTN|nr:DNA polymerase III subunit beta [Tenggerimyces flavus]MBM7784350.1 DNA polymerase-3 subunit beta [Tenggerimyces flavus]